MIKHQYMQYNSKKKKQGKKKKSEVRLELTTSRVSEKRFNHWTIETDNNSI